MAQILQYLSVLLLGVLIGVCFTEEILGLTTKDVEDDN